MNIGFFYGMHTYPPSNGGNIHGYQLVRQLVANGHRLQSCYFGNHNDPDVRDCRGREFLTFLRETDLIYIRLEWQTSAAALSLLQPLSLNTIPVVWEINGTPDELLFSGRSRAEVERINRRLRRWARYCSGAIGVTREIASYASETLGIRNVTTIPNGSAPEIFHPVPKAAMSAKPLEVVWLGTSSAGWHDLPCLLEAAKILKDKNANITIKIFGDKKPLAIVDLPSNVSLEGPIPYKDLTNHLAPSDVGIHLFKNPDERISVKGSPLKIFDYMACGLAVVVNCEGQQSEIMEQHHCGIRCTATAQGVAEALLALERNREWCAQMGANGREAVVNTYNWHNTGKATSDFIEAVLAQHRS